MGDFHVIPCVAQRAVHSVQWAALCTFGVAKKAEGPNVGSNLGTFLYAYIKVPLRMNGTHMSILLQF